MVPENVHTHLPSQGWSLEIPRGRGVSKAKIFKGKYEAEMKIPGGWECPNQKTIMEPHVHIVNQDFSLKMAICRFPVWLPGVGEEMLQIRATSDNIISQIKS